MISMRYIINLIIINTLGIVVGLIGSCYTGDIHELPKWRGVEYGIFCAELGFFSTMIFSGIFTAIYVLVKIINKNSSNQSLKGRM